MSKAAELAALIGSQTALSNRNLIINGAMQVHQRGNQTSANGSSVYFVDRWNLFQNTGDFGADLQQSTVVPSGQGFGNSLLIDCTNADSSVASNDLAVLRQVIEGQNLQSLAYGTSNAKSLTLSFWVRSTKTGTYGVEIFHNDDQSRHQCHPYTISQADTWEYKSITFSGDTSATTDNDNQATFYVQWALTAGTNFTSGTQQTTWADYTGTNRFAGQVNFFDSTSNNFYLTGVQLEVGEQATPFEHRSYGDELARCQRYFCTFDGSVHGQNAYLPFNVWMETSSSCKGSLPFPVTMRAAPTATASGTWFIDGGTSGNPDVTYFQSNANRLCTRLEFTGSLNAEDGGVLRYKTTSSRLDFNAEL